MDVKIPYHDLLNNLFDGVYYVDSERKITFWNRAAERITGFSESEVLGHDCADNILRHIDSTGKELCLKGCPLHQTLRDGEMREAYLFLHHKQGHRVPVHIRITPITDSSGKIIGSVEIFSDNTREQNVLQELELSQQEKFTDPLLGIGNRRFAEVIFKSRQHEMNAIQEPFSVVLIDLDGFKEINDRYGHKIGDQVLQMVVRSIENVLRSLDFVVRWGGDEFILFLPNAADPGLRDVLERIKIIVEKSFLMVNGQKVSVSASMGATVARAEDTLEGIFQRIDELMYRSKEEGKNRYTIG